MRVNGLVYSKKCLILLFILLLFGCATSMHMPLQDMQQLTPKEGIIVGSVLIKGGKDIIGRKRWELLAKDVDLFLSKNYSVKADRGGEEKIFVAKMPVGNYHFFEIYQPGFSTFRIKTNIHFKVQPEKTVYIGRLTIEFSGLLNVFSSPLFKIEDAQETTTILSEGIYENLIRGATKDLMSFE